MKRAIAIILSVLCANAPEQQRRELFPFDSYDVPVNSLIYR